MKIRRELINVFFIGLATILASSCFKDDAEERLTDHDNAFRTLKAYYGITEDENIGDNIYVHFTYMPDTLTNDVMKPDETGYVVLDYVGLNSNLEVFDVTRQEDADEYDLYRSDVVYGPIRMKVNQTFPGFYKAIQHIPEGSSAVILIPHDQAFLNYEPLVYEVSVYRAFNNLEDYNNEQFDVYMDSLGISLNDSISGDSGAYFKITEEGDSIPDLEIGDSVTISLHGYYVETDTAYVDAFPGRQFFPINESGDNITFAMGDIMFPITAIVNDAIFEMKLGESREVISPAEYAYGTDGFLHPYVGIYIVPPSMPLHYTITLDDYKKSEYR